MQVTLRKMENSKVLVPEPIRPQLGPRVAANQHVRDGVIERRPVRRNAREGWAAEARRLALQGTDVLVWPEFGHERDEHLIW